MAGGRYPRVDVTGRVQQHLKVALDGVLTASDFVDLFPLRHPLSQLSPADAVDRRADSTQALEQHVSVVALLFAVRGMTCREAVVRPQA